MPWAGEVAAGQAVVQAVQNAGGVFAGQAYGAAAGAVYLLLLLAVCASDLRARRIPNKLVVVITVLGVVYSVASAPVLPGLGRSLAGIGLGLALWFPFYLFRMLGAGDVKFFAGASAWLGAGAALQAALLSGLIGGALAAVWMIATTGWYRAAETALLQARYPRMAGAFAPQGANAKKLPYGIAMAAGLAVAAWFPHLLW
jgi:prepilin peptidase CpaA